MGEARRRGEAAKLRVLDGGKAARRGPVPQVQHTQLVDRPDHEVIEAARRAAGVEPPQAFDLMLISAGLGCFQSEGFLPLYHVYAEQMEGLRKADQKIAAPTIYGFAGYVTRAGLAALLEKIKAGAANEAPAPPGESA